MVAAVALTLLMPLLVLIGLAVRLTSRGPALFIQERVGQYGQRFAIVKFRTMRVGADGELEALLHSRGEVMGAYVKLTRDPRVTALGRILRRTSLDELPQLWNVVRGEMSLVGPRPQTPAEVAQYEGTAWRRLLVKPGLTGLWQVSGRSDLSPAEGLALDDHYVKHCSPTMDYALILRTIGVVTARRGAY